MKSHNERILKHLKSGKKLTSYSALSLFGCFRLSGRIWDLKQKGHNIKRKMIKSNGKIFAQYSL